MKTFTAGYQLTYGLSVHQHQKFGKSVLVGEFGRGRTQAVVTLDRFRPATIVEVEGQPRIVEALPIPFRIGDRQLCSLAAPKGASEDALVHIETNGGYTRGMGGRPVYLTGRRVIEHAHGVWAYGDAGRVCSGIDSLVQMQPGSVVMVRRAGRAGQGQRNILSLLGGQLVYEETEAWIRGVGGDYAASMDDEDYAEWTADWAQMAPNFTTSLSDYRRHLRQGYAQ